MLEHGERLNPVAERYGIACQELGIGLGGPAVCHGRLHHRLSSSNGVALWLGISLIMGVFGA